MRHIPSSRHARARAQQRAIPPLIIDWLLKYGCRTPTHGRSRVTFDRNARRELEAECGKQAVGLLSKYMSVALVISDEDETVITTYWLH